MDLFSHNDLQNLLPYDGEVLYYGKIMPQVEADEHFNSLKSEIHWRPDEAFIFGKHFVTKREVAWYADFEYAYTYSNITKNALIWTPQLLKLKSLVETLSGHTFNSCLLNLYHNGSEGMGWHSDDEKSLGKNTVIASLSFGADRKFAFKHKSTKQSVSMMLEHGSLLIMQGNTQTNWWHSLPKTTKVDKPRINLTFRTIIDMPVSKS